MRGDLAERGAGNLARFMLGDRSICVCRVLDIEPGTWVAAEAFEVSHDPVRSLLIVDCRGNRDRGGLASRLLELLSGQ